MAAASFNVILIALVLTLCLCESLGDWNDDEKEELPNKEIREKFDVLSNEIIELKNEVKELKAKEGPSEKQMVKNISVLSASRTFLPDGQVCFTVQYKTVGNYGGTPVMWYMYKDHRYSYVQEFLSNEILRLPLYVKQSSTIVPPGNYSYVVFAFGNPNEWINIYLRNDWEGDLIQRDIELPIMEVSPNSEFVYEPGHNVTLKVTVPTEQERSSPGNMLRFKNYKADYNVVLPGGTEIISKFNSVETENFFTRANVKKFLDKERFEAELNTAEYPLMGIFEFTTGSGDPTALVGTIEYTRLFVLRPSTQKGPFPEGQLYASGYEWSKTNEDGDYEKFCKYGESCYVYCDVLGDDVTDLKLYETLNGNTRRLPMRVHGRQVVISYRMAGQYAIDTNRGAPSPVTYTCAGSNARGRTVTRKLVVTLGQEVKIVNNETHVENFGNGTALVTCTATGLPLPKVSITCDQITVTEPDVIYQSEDVISISTKCSVLDSYLWATCNAENKHSSDMDSMAYSPHI